MVWDRYLNKGDDPDLLKEKAYCLTKLILDASSSFHQMAVAVASQPFDDFLLQFSEAESVALYIVTAFSLMELYRPRSSEMACISNEMMRAIIIFLRIKEPTGLLAAYFVERYEVLDDLITKMDASATSGWKAEIKSSYEKQCEHLGLAKNALLIELMESSLLKNLDDWNLYSLVTGKL